MMQIVPLQPMEVHNGADIHTAADGGPRWRRWMYPEGICDPMESTCRRRLVRGTVTHGEEPLQEHIFWQDLWHHGGPTLEQSSTEGLHPTEGTHTRAVHEKLHSVGRTDVGEAHEGLSHEKNPMLEQGKSVRRKEQQMWTVMSWLQPPPPSSFADQGQEVEKSEVKLNLRREGWGEGDFSIVLISHYPTLLRLVGNKLNEYAQVKTVLPVIITDEWSPYSYLDPWGFWWCSLPPSLFMEEDRRSSFLSNWQPGKVNPAQALSYTYIYQKVPSLLSWPAKKIDDWQFYAWLTIIRIWGQNGFSVFKEFWNWAFSFA